MFRTVALLLSTLLFIVYQSWPLFTAIQEYNDDQNNIYLLATRRGDPDFLAEDYAYGNPNFLKFYTPFYLDLVRFLIEQLGSYNAAILTLHSVMLSVYLFSMFVLLYYVTDHIWVALMLALFSALARPAIASEVWGASGIHLVFPRTLFLAVAPLLFWLMFRWLSRPEWWRVALLGFLGGVAANLHPPSGMFFVQILITLVLAFSCTSLWQVAGRVAVIGAASLSGALPTLIPLLQNLSVATGEQQSPSFDKFANLVHERLLSLLPLPPDQVMLPAGPLTERWQMNLAVAGLILSLGWLGMAVWQKWRQHLHRRLLIAGLLFISLPLAYLVTIFSALDLIIVALAYWTVRLIRQDEDRLDLYALGILASAAIYSYVGSMVMGWIWEMFEIWSLTSFYGEQPRMSRFVYLPLFIFMARWLVLLLQQNRSRVIGSIVVSGLIAGWVVRHWHFRDSWGTAEWAMGASLLILALAGIWSCFKEARPDWPTASILGLSLAATVYLWLYILGLPQAGLGAVIVGLSGALLYYYQRLSLRQWQLVSSGVVVIALSWLFLHGKVTLSNEHPLRVQAYKALNLYDYNSADQENLDTLAMYRWIKENTLPRTVFYYNDRQLEFRSQTHRAVTHSWKDLGGAYYTPSLLMEYYDRFNKLEAAYESPEKLMVCARAYHADYIISRTRQPELPLTLVYSNESYRVYSVEREAGVDNEGCS